jgi:hypothetical protein
MTKKVEIHTGKDCWKNKIDVRVKKRHEIINKKRGFPLTIDKECKLTRRIEIYTTVKD